MNRNQNWKEDMAKARKKPKKKKTINYRYINYISKILEDISGINPFENTRRMEVIEIRSVLVYIMREVERMSYHSIKDYFRSKGKHFDHATAMHSYRNFEMYCRYNKKIEDYFYTLIDASSQGDAKKIVAKKIIDNNDPTLAEIFTYLVNK